jgi:hypothetical protein
MGILMRSLFGFLEENLPRRDAIRRLVGFPSFEITVAYCAHCLVFARNFGLSRVYPEVGLPSSTRWGREQYSSTIIVVYDSD